MIVVDTSALAAVLFHESDADHFSRIIAHEDLVIGAPTRFEFLMVARGRRGEEGLEQARHLLDLARIGTVAWDESFVEVAMEAFHRFGKPHRAALNFGDCLAYAVARSLDAPLLFKGDDFRLTDIPPVL